MKQNQRYSSEVRERAVRMVLEHQADYASQWTAVGSIAGKIGCPPERCGAGFAKPDAIVVYGHWPRPCNESS